MLQEISLEVDLLMFVRLMKLLNIALSVVVDDVNVDVCQNMIVYLVTLLR